MSHVVRHAVAAVTLLVGIPLAGLLAYDVAAVRPRVAGIEALLAQADPHDASPPQIIRDLIDAGAGSPRPHATRLVVNHVYGTDTSGMLHRHVRELLWRMLLPLHFDDTQLYGLVASQSYNGVDAGLSRFAQREYGKRLDALSPRQAALTVAVIHGPSFYLRDRRRLEARADRLLARAGHGR
jgi:hypothetical protein